MSTGQRLDVSKSRTIGSPPKAVKVVIRQMTTADARKEFPYRPFAKNCESYYGGDDLLDDERQLRAELALRCKMCQAVTRKEHLEAGICPDCDGRSEYDGNDPRQPR